MSNATGRKVCKCMGNLKNEAQCQKCKRLPQEAKDENDDCWYDYKTQKIPCKNFLKIEK